ncbi:MAG: hypothetical protein IJ761_07970 [Bacteroidales bacterium]|nr:hypothetical protein [Bacteroidales bacterium]
MKRIVLLVMATLLVHGFGFAQKPKSVLEKDVKVNYVRDFHTQVQGASSIKWWAVDSNTYKVTFLDSEKSSQAMIFSNKGTETHYYIESKYWPSSIKETVKNDYADYTITDTWVRKYRGKMTYQARIAKKSGFLWWKKEKDVKILNFETSGKFVNGQ